MPAPPTALPDSDGLPASTIPPTFQAHNAVLDLVEGASNGIVMVDAAGLIVLVNQEAERVFGYARADLLGRSIEMLLPERFRGAHGGHRAQYLARPNRRTLGAEREIFGLRADGSEFPAEIGLSCVQSDGGLLAVASVIDISVRQTFEQDLREAAARLKQLSLFDSLTGLPNRILLFDRLDQALHTARRAGTSLAIMMIDLNLFKEVNDTLGHAAGDTLLADIGRRFLHLTRAADTFARIGGDEFAALLVGCDSILGAVLVADKIHEALNEPLTVEDQVVRVTAAIGVALFPEHGTDSRSLLAHADHAMYIAKRSSRSCEVYASEGRETRPFLISCDLPGAIERGELFLEYQPKLDLATRALCGVEALVRWRHPRLGLIGPDEFIGIAERTAIIKPMTYAILDMALDQAACWHKLGLHIPIAVNLSARMVDNHHLTHLTCAALESRGLKPVMLTFEVTETALMASPLRVQESLRSLREAGIGISIDDFGAGYTSLKYLRDFVISEIKIDKLFITALTPTSRDVAIVRSIATLSNGFGVKLVAEGIENEAQIPLLQELGCEYGQGYALGRPMSAEAFAHWRSARAALDELISSDGVEASPIR